MEIQAILKSYQKIIKEKIISIKKNLKQIKLNSVDLLREVHVQRKQFLIEIINESSKKILNLFSVSQRKVFRAYLNYHMSVVPKRQNYLNTFSNGRPTQFQLFSNEDYQSNILFNIFKNWFFLNIHQKQNTTNSVKSLQNLIQITQKLLQSLWKQFQGRNQIEQMNHEVQNVCQSKLVLILITQLNLCILLLKNNKVSLIQSLLKKAKGTLNRLKEIQNDKNKQIKENVNQIQKLNEEQETRIKRIHLNKRKISLCKIQSNQSTLFQNNCSEEYLNKNTDIYQENQKQKTQIWKRKQKILQKTKVVIEDKIKLDYFIQNFSSRISMIQNELDIKMGRQIVLNYLCKQRNKDLIKIFKNQKLNKSFNTAYEFQQTNLKPFQQICNQILNNQKTLSSQTIYLNVQNSKKKSLDISLKDYFNLCLFLKKINFFRESKIYFEILVYQFQKKQLLKNYCMQGIQDFQKFGQFQQNFHFQNTVEFQKKTFYLLKVFVKNQDLIKVFLYSLINLVELYDNENLSIWSLKTLKYLKHILELQILDFLNKIKTALIQIQKSKKSLYQESNLQFNHTTIQINQISRLYEHYFAILQQIKFRILQASLHLNFITFLPKNGKKLIKNNKSQKQTIQKQHRITLNLKKLEQKQNQLQNLKSTKIKNNKFQTCTLTPTFSQKRYLFNQLKYPFQNIIKKTSQLKGSAYQSSNKTFERKKLIFLEPKINITNRKYTTRKPDEPEKGASQNSKLLKKITSIKQSTKNIIKDHSNDKGLITLKNIASSSKQINTLTFLDTSKSIVFSSKQARLTQFRQKILEKKEELERYLKLNFQKLNSLLKPSYYSTICLSEETFETWDVSQCVEQLLKELNELLQNLKTFNIHTQETFQRSLIIDYKIKVTQIMKSKCSLQRLTATYEQLIIDIKLLRDNEKRVNIKKYLLWRLANAYHQYGQTNKALSNYLQLARLCEPIGYLRMGQLYMSKKDFGNSIRYYQKYATEKDYDLQSRIKLAHAYSKIPQYCIKTIDILSSLLLTCVNSTKFKSEIIQRKDDDGLIQSAVILLSSLYFKNDNIDKAIQLCQNYNQINIKNYRAMHVLGGYYKAKQNTNKSFLSYMNALQNNPSHSYSLIELTSFIREGYDYKAQVIQLLRKCYYIQNKNFQILKALIKFLSENQEIKCTEQNGQLNYFTLIKYAQILKQSKNRGFSNQNFYQQAVLTYQWALILLNKNINLVNFEIVEQIYKNLGQICFKKGDYIKSQNYYKLYIMEMQKYVNNTSLNEVLRMQKINRTKIQTYYLLGKVKKYQKNYSNSIQYFQKSIQISRKLDDKIKSSQKYLHLFQIAQCYFLQGQFDEALKKFQSHKSYLIKTIITEYDEKFLIFNNRSLDMTLNLFAKKGTNSKTNHLKQLKKRQKQIKNISTTQKQNTQKLLKTNYFETQIYIAFSFDKLSKFKESKQIYLKILNFIRQNQAEKLQKQHQISKIKTKRQLNQYIKQNGINPISKYSHQPTKQEYKQFKRVCLLNLANIYKIQSEDQKFLELMEQYMEICPEHFQIRKKLMEYYKEKGLKRESQKHQQLVKSITNFKKLSPTQQNSKQYFYESNTSSENTIDGIISSQLQN